MPLPVGSPPLKDGKSEGGIPATSSSGGELKPLLTSRHGVDKADVEAAAEADEHVDHGSR